ncbi:MAG: NAD+ synthase [Candidatus Omnitrophica bacterium]|nr:NAD+ synthase [Candidatus Omnitrophota bacterium]
MRSKIVNWIKKEIKASGAKGIVLGLSGGIDSSVVAALSKEAVGKNNVLGLFLPCHSQPQDLADAKLLAKNLGIQTKLLDLSNIFDSLTKILPEASPMARANLKPRLRMLTLYYFANKYNYLVAGTGNKSELSVGYFTKHGDGATDILPIGCLLKRQVVALAKELKIPEQIITKPPTAGLWPGQTDEKEMGITYLELDDILDCMYKNRKQSASKIKVSKVVKMHKLSEHKRQGPKICLI